MAAPQAAARPGGAAPPRPRPGPPEKPPPPFDVGLLLSLVSGLGSVKQLADGSAAYVADEQCLDCLYDIQRFLRRDEPATRDVVCQLSDWNALRQHFVPLLVTYASKFDVAFNATKVRACACLCVCGGAPRLLCGKNTGLSC
jgi:Timeless protein